MKNVLKNVCSKSNRIRCSSPAKVEIKGTYFMGIVRSIHEILEKYCEIRTSDGPKSISRVSDVRLTFAAFTELYKVILTQVLYFGEKYWKTFLNTAHNMYGVCEIVCSCSNNFTFWIVFINWRNWKKGYFTLC